MKLTLRIGTWCVRSRLRLRLATVLPLDLAGMQVTDRPAIGFIGPSDGDSGATSLVAERNCSP
jgi:hypothetical protein